MSGLGEFMVLSCIDTVEVILSDWRDTKKNLEKWLLLWLGMF